VRVLRLARKAERCPCSTTGARTTNGNDHDAVDDANPELHGSTRWYGIRPPGRSPPEAALVRFDEHEA
jgi:hypothetical protein